MSTRGAALACACVVVACGQREQGPETGPPSKPTTHVAIDVGDPSTPIVFAATERAKDVLARVNGRDPVTFVGPSGARCTSHLPSPDDKALYIELEGGETHLGLSDARPVLTGHDLTHDRDAPFFKGVQGVQLAVDDSATGAQLGDVMAAFCDSLTAWRFVDLAPVLEHRRRVRTLPACRKVEPESARDGMPALDAMDLCYVMFTQRPGPVGTAHFAFELGPDGSVRNAKVSGLEPATDECLAWLVARGHFPNPSGKSLAMRVTAECNTRCCNGD